MRRYSDYQKDKNKILTKEELSNIEWIKYKIVVPTEEDKEELMLAIEDIHHCNIDTDIIGVNQLAHEYLKGTNIVVDKDLYEKLNMKTH